MVSRGLSAGLSPNFFPWERLPTAVFEPSNLCMFAGLDLFGRARHLKRIAFEGWKNLKSSGKPSKSVWRTPENHRCSLKALQDTNQHQRVLR